MAKTIKESAVARVDLSGLESSDLLTISEILRLAGQAEIDDDSVEVMSPPADVYPDAGMDAGMDLGGGYEEEVYQEEQPYDEVDDIIALSGINEELTVQSTQENPDGTMGAVEQTDVNMVENRLLPDSLLGESPDEEFGPFRTEFEAVSDASAQTNGRENEHFHIVPRGNSFFWKRNIQEDVQNRPEPEEVNTDGIINSRHRIRDKKSGIGDNRLYPVNESDNFSGEDSIEDGDNTGEESVEEIFESINKRFNKFMGE